jgi:hypothetical protein
MVYIVSGNVGGGPGALAEVAAVLRQGRLRSELLGGRRRGLGAAKAPPQTTTKCNVSARTLSMRHVHQRLSLLAQSAPNRASGRICNLQ